MLLLERNSSRLRLAEKFQPASVCRLCPTPIQLLSDHTLLHGFPMLLGYDATYSPVDGSHEAWLTVQMAVLQYLYHKHSLMGFILMIPLTCNPLVRFHHPMTHLEALVTKHLQEFVHIWNASVTVVYCQDFGDNICRVTAVIQGVASRLQTQIAPPTAPADEAVGAPPYALFLDRCYNILRPAWQSCRYQ
jgi:hypothetical protein